MEENIQLEIENHRFALSSLSDAHVLTIYSSCSYTEKKEILQRFNLPIPDTLPARIYEVPSVGHENMWRVRINNELYELVEEANHFVTSQKVQQEIEPGTISWDETIAPKPPSPPLNVKSRLIQFQALCVDLKQVYSTALLHNDATLLSSDELLVMFDQFYTMADAMEKNISALVDYSTDNR